MELALIRKGFADSGLNVSTLLLLVDAVLDLDFAAELGIRSRFDFPPGRRPSNGVGGTYGNDCQLGNLTKSALELIRLAALESPSLMESFSLNM